MSSYKLPTVSELVEKSFTNISFADKAAQLKNQKKDVPTFFKVIAAIVMLVISTAVIYSFGLMLDAVNILPNSVNLITTWVVGFWGGYAFFGPLLIDFLEDMSSRKMVKLRDRIYYRFSKDPDVNTDAFYKKVTVNNHKVDVSIWSLAGENLWEHFFEGVEHEEEITDCVLSVNVLIEQANYKMKEDISESEGFAERMQRISAL